MAETEVHGYATVRWEYYLIPRHFWERLEADEATGCWRWVGRKDVNARLAMAMRLGAVKRREEVLALVPTCGFIDCANPAHTCLTLARNR